MVDSKQLCDILHRNNVFQSHNKGPGGHNPVLLLLLDPLLPPPLPPAVRTPLHDAGILAPT